jgi:hypothetical protein
VDFFYLIEFVLPAKYNHNCQDSHYTFSISLKNYLSVIFSHLARNTNLGCYNPFFWIVKYQFLIFFYYASAPLYSVFFFFRFKFTDAILTFFYKFTALENIANNFSTIFIVLLCFTIHKFHDFSFHSILSSHRCHSIFLFLFNMLLQRRGSTKCLGNY